MTSEKVVEACEFNYIDFWRCATAASDGEYSEEGGIVRCVTGLPQDIFNVVLYCRLTKESVADRIDRAIDEFRSRRIPMIWHVGRTSVPAEIGAYLEHRGFPHDYDLVAMAVETASLQAHSQGRGVTTRRCESTDDIERWIECLATSWDSPDKVAEWMRANPFFNARSNQGSRSEASRIMYLGLLNGVPSGAVMLFISRNVAGLQCVGTVPRAQRKGVGVALVQAALKDAEALGHKLVVVLSTTEGVPLYTKAGFRPIGKLPEHSMYFDRLPR